MGAPFRSGLGAPGTSSSVNEIGREAPEPEKYGFGARVTLIG